MRRNTVNSYSKKQKNQFNLTIGAMIILTLLVIFGSMVYRAATFSQDNITPTNYEYTVVDDNSIREVFAIGKEFRIADTWVLPFNRSSGKIANTLDRAAKRNAASLARDGSYDVKCHVKTWGVRSEVLSLYPHIYEVECNFGA